MKYLMTTLQQLKESIDANYTKSYAVGHASELFSKLSSTRKEKIIRSLYMNDMTIKHVWYNRGNTHYEVVSAKYHKILEAAKYLGENISTDGMKTYTVIVDRRLRWHCNCYWFGKCQNADYCTHISQIKLTNILKEYINYFIYLYRFLLPDTSYRKFIVEFNYHE